jgi:hypothetical protein
MNPLLRAALPFRPKSRRKSRHNKKGRVGERIKYRIRTKSRHMKDAYSK